jgi:hypothetical protein
LTRGEPIEPGPLDAVAAGLDSGLGLVWSLVGVFGPLGLVVAAVDVMERLRAAPWPVLQRLTEALVLVAASAVTLGVMSMAGV